MKGFFMKLPCPRPLVKSPLTTLLKLAATISSGCLLLSSCTYVSQGILVDSDRFASTAQVDHFGDSAERTVYPEQNWSGADSLWFYTITQGSDLIPYDIFMNLEVADSSALFRADDNINRLRYLPQRASHGNPDALPVGWVKDSFQGKDYIGFTCAACHTGQINYKGTAIRIDGAPTLADMDMMLKDIAAALDASLNQPDKFARLAKNILGEKYPTGSEDLRSRLQDTAAQVQLYNRVNAPLHGELDVAYGYGRVDAFGRIYNRILGHLTPDEPNYNPASAPVSYPFLWDTPQHDFVQWNGSADNSLAGPLGRNTGEVLGVFAHFDLTKRPRDAGYRSSVVLRNLARSETHLEDLWSPRWQDLSDQQILPPIDQMLAQQGQQIFAEYQCQSCHLPIERNNPKRRIIAQMASLRAIGTDPIMAMNALKYQGKSGVFEGQSYKYIDPRGPKFGPQTPVLPALSRAAEGVILEPDHDKSLVRRWAEKVYDLIASIDHNPIKKTQKHLDFEVVPTNSPAAFAAYKGRALNGIWATAPYLHNGSVPNLYELFLPSCRDAEIATGKACRSNKFTLGTREFDPANVGYKLQDATQHAGLFVFDTHLPSNSNKGHEYAAGVTPVMELDANGKPLKDANGKPRWRKLQALNHEQRLALVEYLKTL
jgi:hypothetical protein